MADSRNRQYPSTVDAAGDSETLLARAPQAAPPPRPSRGYPAPNAPQGNVRAPEPGARRRRFVGRLMEGRTRPFLRLLFYYVVLTTVMSLLVYAIPAVREAFLAPSALSGEEGGNLVGPVTEGYGDTVSLNEALERAIATLLVIAGALSLVVPVAWALKPIPGFPDIAELPSLRFHRLTRCAPIVRR